jgi:DNA-binding CsgD family transcriptional regulator
LSGRNLFAAAQFAVWLEEHEAARVLAAKGTRDSETHASLTMIPTLAAVRAEVSLREGRLLEASATASEALALAEEFGQKPAEAFAGSVLATAQAAISDVPPQLVHRLHQNEVAAAASSFYLTAALGAAALSNGNLDTAVAHLAEVERAAEVMGIVEPNVVQWQADYVEALALAGRTQDAERQLRRFERVAVRSGRRWALAASARCRAMLAPADDLDRAFARALPLHLAVTSPFERARTELAWGRRAVEAGRRVDAGAHLSLALAAFDALGARRWAEQADEILRRAGQRPQRREGPALGELTEHEAQVAILVTEGLSNREVAQRLFVSEKTVEFHLSRVYRKLQIRSRTQLARVLT